MVEPGIIHHVHGQHPLFGGAASAAHPEPTTKADCKNGEFAEYKTSGRLDATQRFKNQGDCIQFVNTGK